VIHLDNAKYHKAKVDAPSLSQKKATLMEACRGFLLDDSGTLPILRDRLRTYIAAHVRPRSETLAEQYGHRLLWTPPYYSKLQPIERVWAVVKNEIARQHTKATSFQVAEVRQRIR
jgi:hypothetical protein